MDNRLEHCPIAILFGNHVVEVYGVAIVIHKISAGDIKRVSHKSQIGVKFHKPGADIISFDGIENQMLAIDLGRVNVFQHR